MLKNLFLADWARARKPGAAGLMICLAVFLISCVPTARAASPQEIDTSIQKAADYLYSKQQDGLWESAGLAELAPTGMHHGGLTAIATYALLAAGEDPTDPRLARAIEFLKELQTTDAYVLGMRAQVWRYLPRTPEIQQLIARDTELLIDGIKAQGPARGLFYYPNTAANLYDHSISQFGVLGLWAGVQNGAQVPPAVWTVMDQAWRAHQSQTGGWPYIIGSAAPGEGDDCISMTCAGVASLLIISDFKNGDSDIVPGDPNVNQGLKWIADNFATLYQNGLRQGSTRYYTLYGIERIGVAGGYKYFGNTNWFSSGSEYLLRTQNGDGSWAAANDLFGANDGNIPDTCFAILFFIHGRAPVVINKLSYVNNHTGETDLWNARPRDIANLTRWAGMQVESLLNWHIVTLAAPLPELHDAPILYLAGAKPLTFSDADLAKLRQFVEEGGMILANADQASRGFVESAKKLGATLFPAYAFRELPADHVLYTNEQFPGRKFRQKPRVMGLSNGVRELFLLSADQDPSRAWQRHVESSDLFRLGADIIQYATDRKGLDEGRVLGHYKYTSLGDYESEPDTSVKADRSAAVARLEYHGNWNPEPGGWPRLAAILHNQFKTDVDVQTVNLGEGQLNAATTPPPPTSKPRFQIADLTGTSAFQLTEPQRQEIKNFVNAGGTLVVDAAGGSSPFAASAEKELTALFGADTVTQAMATPLPLENGLYTLPSAKIESIEYRTFARRRLGALKTPQICGIVQNGRIVAYYSRHDLSAGLVGQQVDGIDGYDPASATAIMRNIVLQAAGSQ